jgi:catechol 2,3-dioxygenase-like lactoylglutathione lyase family enzyme
MEPQMLTRVDHIDIKVLNLEDQVNFFKTLGLVEIRRTPAPRLSVEMALPGPDQVVFELRVAEPGQEGCSHIAFKVEKEDAVDELKARGIHFDTERRLIKDTGRTVSNFKDASGNSWQLTD